MTRPHAFVRTLAVAAAAALLLPAASSAQNLIVDRGTFLLSREGRAVGTEEFIIRRTGSGPDSRIIATAEIRIQPGSDVRHVTPALEVSARDLRIQAYQVKIAGDRQSEIYMTLSGDRYQAKVMTQRGEELREFRARVGSVLLDDGVVHHYYFLAAQALNGARSVPTLVPRAGRQLRVQVTGRGTERIQVAGRQVQARHLQVEDDGAARDVWVDDEGRVLLLVDPVSGLRAERKDLPG